MVYMWILCVRLFVWLSRTLTFRLVRHLYRECPSVFFSGYQHFIKSWQIWHWAVKMGAASMQQVQVQDDQYRLAVSFLAQTWFHNFARVKRGIWDCHRAHYMLISLPRNTGTSQSSVHNIMSHWRLQNVVQADIWSHLVSYLWLFIAERQSPCHGKTVFRLF